ncbi:MAG: hypothetical protein NTV80_06320, partial [Verrucomicrobia bacterium]|nr:hypothetical protein [Verrucomicrobiota bacterium]
MKPSFTHPLVRVFFLLASLQGTGTVRAQTAAFSQADVARQQSVAQGAWGNLFKADNEVSEANAPEEAPKMGGDEEYGEQLILLRRASWAPWSLETDVEALWTDNVALAAKNMQSDTYLRTGLRAGYSNRVAGNIFFTGGLDYHTVRH